MKSHKTEVQSVKRHCVSVNFHFVLFCANAECNEKFGPALKHMGQ